MFTKSEIFYDKIYSYKNYKEEVEKLVAILSEFIKINRQSLLDVACGTGLHAKYLSDYFKVDGLDISEEFIHIAQKRNPNLLFFQGDMTNFQLYKKYDIITCLFSSIGYVKTSENLTKALEFMANHLLENGLLVIEPWFTPDQWIPNTVHSLFIDEPELKIARISTSFKQDNLSYFDLHYLIGTPEKTEYFIEHHELGLFEKDVFHKIIEHTGFKVKYYSEGITGRGLYVGVRK